jgi:uncharacterized membrane protein
MIFALSIFAASILLGILLAYLFLQYTQRKNLTKYNPESSKSNPSPRSSPKGEKNRKA